MIAGFSAAPNHNRGVCGFTADAYDRQAFALDAGWAAFALLLCVLHSVDSEFPANPSICLLPLSAMPGHHALSKDGAHFAVAMPDGRIQLWSVRSGKLVTVLSHEKTAASRISSLLFSATGSLLLAGLHSGEVVAYTVSTAGVLFSVRCGNQKRKVTSIQSSADDTTVFAASADGSVYVIDVGSQAVLSSFSAGKVVQMLVLSARYIVTASSRISLWDLSTMKCIASRSGHASSVASLAAFSPPSTSGEGLFLASCAENDRFISFWDMSESGSELAVRVVPCSSAPTWLAVTVCFCVSVFLSSFVSCCV